jgi:hypothetical protein
MKWQKPDRKGGLLLVQPRSEPLLTRGLLPRQSAIGNRKSVIGNWKNRWKHSQETFATELEGY